MLTFLLITLVTVVHFGAKVEAELTECKKNADCPSKYCNPQTRYCDDMCALEGLPCCEKTDTNECNDGPYCCSGNYCVRGKCKATDLDARTCKAGVEPCKSHRECCTKWCGNDFCRTKCRVTKEACCDHANCPEEQRCCSSFNCVNGHCARKDPSNDQCTCMVPKLDKIRAVVSQHKPNTTLNEYTNTLLEELAKDATDPEEKIKEHIDVYQGKCNA